MGRSKRRLLVLYKPKDSGDLSAGNVSMGRAKEFIESMRPFNTAPERDDDPGTGATRTLYGPGMSVEFATASPDVMQAMVAVNELDIAFPVLMRMCRRLGMKLQDTDSGQVFG